MSASRKLLDDCFLHDGKRLRHAEALAILKSRVQPLVGSERVTLACSVGRIVGETIAAGHPVPAHTNAAVDGYAFAVAQTDPFRATELDVVGRAAAGHPLPRGNGGHSAARILTGAVMPDGTDTVVMQEDVTLCGVDGEQRVLIPPGLKRGANVRRAGEDVKQGETLFEPGHVLRPQDLAALASVGRAEVECFSRLSVAILSSGDEVIRAGSGPLPRGHVYDANAPMLDALVVSAGADCHDLGIHRDDPAVIRKALAEAAGRHHVIITSGGASRGDEDHMVTALDALGKCHLWQLAIKPGRPMGFGQIGDCVVICLPGNPVAVFVCFLMYVWPMLRQLSGSRWPEPRRYTLPAAFDFKGRKSGRREFWRAMLIERDGGLAVTKFERDGSGLISGLRAADGLIEIPEDAGDIAEGDLVSFIPFTEFGIAGR
jgi:molybdopterin molybdotransferase